MTHFLPQLPFAQDLLEPHISFETLEYHHGKHHKSYVDKLNKLIIGTKYEQLILEDIVLQAKPGAILNNAAQHWNHSFFWKCLTPEFSDSKHEPTGNLMMAVRKQFGTVEGFKEQFNDEALEHFGSGYAWLVMKDDGSVDLRMTHDADNPLRHGEVALLCCDLWEHAYYIDYRNERAKFLNAFWRIANWDFASSNFEFGNQHIAA